MYKNKIKGQLREKILKQYNESNCPVCGREYFKINIDHVLPQSKYVQYSITPINLVPMCSDCNKIKGDVNYGFHPFFEDYSRLEGLSFDIRYNTVDEDIKINLVYESDISEKLKKCLNFYGMDIKIKIESKKKIKKIKKNLGSGIKKKDLIACLESLKSNLKFDNNNRHNMILFDYLLNNSDDLYDYIVN